MRQLGQIGNIAAETQAILADCNIKDAPFLNRALQGLPKLPWHIPAAEYKKRRDLREYRIFTIDPSTAKGWEADIYVRSGY